MRCIHCLQETDELTKDHVFPISWYPDNTPLNEEKWTAPSCRACNGALGAKESHLFSRLALSTNPAEPASSGIAERALRSFGVRPKPTTSEEELERRNQHRQRILDDIQNFSGEIRPIPRADLPFAQGIHPPVIIPINGNLMHPVYVKIVKGCEYILGNGRYVEPPYEVHIFDGSVSDHFDEVFKEVLVSPLSSAFRVKRVYAIEDPLVVVYEITLWESHKILAMIDRVQ